MNLYLRLKKMMNFKKVNFKFFLNNPPTQYIKFKAIDFAPSNVEFMTNSLFEPIWNDFYEGLNLRLRVNSAKYIAR